MKRLHILFILAALVPALGFAQMDLQPAALVKLVRTEPITVKQLKDEVTKVEQAYQRVLTASERRQVLEAMIDERLFLQAAERDKVTVTPAEVEAQIGPARDSLAAKMGRDISDAEFSSLLKANTGYDLASYRDQIRRTLVMQKYLMAKKGEQITSIQRPTNEEVQAAYDMISYTMMRPPAVRLSILSFPFGPAPDGRQQALSRAEKALAEIGGSSGKYDTFFIKAQQNQGDDILANDGYMYRSAESQSMVGANFFNTAFNLKLNEVSKLVEGNEAYFILKLTESYAQKIRELSDPYELGQPGTVRDYIEADLVNKKTAPLIEKLTQELLAELKVGNPFQIFENNLNW